MLSFSLYYDNLDNNDNLYSELASTIDFVELKGS